MLKKLKNFFVYCMAIGFLAWDTLIYKPAHYIFEKLSKIIVFEKLEAAIKGLSPGVSLGLFGLILVVLFPLKLSAVWLMHKNVLLGGLSYFGLKILGMFLITRTFELVEQNIRKIQLVNTVLDRFFEFKHKIVAYYKETLIYKKIHQFKETAKIFIKSNSALVKNWIKSFFKHD